MTGPRSWDDILEPGEQILWQGRPDARLVFPPERKGAFWLGLLLIGAGVVQLSALRRVELGITLWPYALIPVALGLALLVGQPIWTRLRRRRSWYTLTNRRAFIATELPILGRRLKSWPVQSEAPLILSDGEPASVWFAERRTRTDRGHVRVTPIGFERLPDAAEVAARMRALREGRE